MSSTENKLLQTPNEMVKVVLRCRPLNAKEKAMGCISVVKVYPPKDVIEVYSPHNDKSNFVKIFTFDSVYDWNCTQRDIYNKTALPLITAVLNGFNGTVFAYGQSGTGKTYTMEGDGSDECARGIIPRTFEQIFDHISTSCNMQYLVRVSYLEIYQDEVIDLLAIKEGKTLELRENKEMGVYVKNISSFVCKSVNQMETIITTGKKNRTTGTTDLNERSSRSHAIVTITVEMRDTKGPLENRVRVGKLNLVDLAGSERQNKTNAEGRRLKEATKINLSLTSLGNVISALASKNENYIPYRDSKLTRLLSNSLGGNSKTVMIANIGPSSYNYDESLNTLRYACRARNIKNKPQINEDPTDALIRKYQDEIKRLKCQLALKNVLQQAHGLNKRRQRDEGLHGSCKDLNNDCATKDVNGVRPTPIDNDRSCKLQEMETLVGNSGNTTEHFDKLLKRIESMESKILTGSNASSFIEHTIDQQRTLKEKFFEIEVAKQRENEVRGLLELEEEIAKEITVEFSNLQEEVGVKSKTLLTLLKKLQYIQQQTIDAKDEYNYDRRDLETTKYELLKDLKLKLLMMDNFVQKEDRRKILSRLYFDEELDSWKLMPELELAQTLTKQQSVHYVRRPESFCTAFSRRKVNHIFRCDRTKENRERTFRFKGENILELDLVDAQRTTKDYHLHEGSSKVTLSSMLQTVLQGEDNIDIDAADPSFRINTAKLRPGRMNLQMADHKQVINQTTPATIPVYPIPRGLVPK